MTSGDTIVCSYCGHAHPVHVHEKFSWTESKTLLSYGQYRCPDCGLYFSGPMDQTARDSVESHFDTLYNNNRLDDLDASLRCYWDPSLRSRATRWISYLNQRRHRWMGGPGISRYGQILDAVLDDDPSTLLDVGCSYGLLLSLCRSAGLDCYGVEPSHDVVRRLWLAGGGNRVEQGFFPQSKGPKGGYDRITLVNTMMAIPDASREFFAACKALLNPGGRLIIYDIDPDSRDPGVAIAFAAPVWLSFPSVKFMERVAADLGFSGYETEPARLEADKRLHVLKL